MENLNVLSQIKCPTRTLNQELIQEVLLKAKKCDRTSQQNEKWKEVCELLWGHLQTGLQKFDNQLLCATCLYTVLSLTDKENYYVNEVLQIIKNEIIRRENENGEIAQTSIVVSYMYGIFQSSFLTDITTKNYGQVCCTLDNIYKLLISMAYEYSKFTFIVFKIICSFKKVVGTKFQQVIFNNDYQINLLNLVNENWENPINGVRDLNKTIFQTVISVMDNSMYDLVLSEINDFYWSKAKYLMLAEIIDLSKIDVTKVLLNTNWVEGVVNTLNKPGLVSAGADMYFAILKKINHPETWCTMFMAHIINIIKYFRHKAIENFNNYWCLTTLKAFPSLSKILINELSHLDNSECKLYGILCIAKQAYKLGHIDKNWDQHQDIEKYVTNVLKHPYIQIRMLAIDIICVSRSKDMPDQVEYVLVLDFLNSNINCDCKVLRIGLLKNFNNLMIRIHTTFLNNKKNTDIFNSAVESLLKFCEDFQVFVIESLNIDGNYQRKVTCVKLISIFLQSLHEIPKKRQKQTRQGNISIIESLKQNGQWIMADDKLIIKLVSLLQDPAEDIRENVIQLLLQNFSSEISNKDLFNSLIDNALKSMKSKFFYEISCGYSIFKLIIQILIKEKRTDTKFKSVEHVFGFATDEIFCEYRLKSGIVESIKTGKQLHSLINILHAVLEICLQSTYKIKISKDKLLELLNVLEGISNQFAWEEESSISSDFSKMSNMVQNLIKASSSNYDTVDVNQTQISGMEQIVLNCLWLNVKASCDLSSLLIKYNTEDLDFSEKCLYIITNALETCRHKGAIEAAGVALGKSIQYLTTLPEESDMSKIPMALLKCKLNDLIREASKMASVTRRGAGLSIMVHRIVSNDTNKGKPLFHFLMATLLAACTNNIPNQNCEDVDNEKDLPKAIYIHFLTRIVTDSSLASDMMFYSAQLAELAFSNLTSPHWQIRNAALQLYGALIPKLIGQKKASGDDEETISTVACDELRTHSPKLWRYIQQQLSDRNYTDQVQFHSNLLPILNLLANIAKRYRFTFGHTDDTKLLEALILLLDSPIYTVRRLTAKSIFNIYSFEKIYEKLAMVNIMSENLFHGSLILLAVCYKAYKDIAKFAECFDKLKIKYESILALKQHSYLSREIFEEIFYKCENEHIVQNVKHTFHELNSQSNSPGIFIWVNKRFRIYIFQSPWMLIPDILEMILHQNNFEDYIKLLMIRIDKDQCHPTEEFILIAKILLSFQNKYQSGIIWECLYSLSGNVNLYGQVDVSEMLTFLETGVAYKLRYMVPLAARVLTNSSNENQLIIVSRIIQSMINIETNDIDMRYTAAIANNELGKSFSNLPESVRIIALMSEVILLQDEDEGVRKVSIDFLKSILSSDIPHPFICLTYILDSTFLMSVLSKSGRRTFIHKLTAILSQFSTSRYDNDNPFASESKNIYLETNVYKSLINSLKLE